MQQRTWSRCSTLALHLGDCAGWSYALCTRPRPGAAPRANQDAVLAGDLNGVGVFAVADGVGGHRGGAAAARRALSTVADCGASDGPAPAAARLAQALLLEQLARPRRRGLTTLTAIFLGERTAASVHVGDSGFAVFSSKGHIKHRSVAQSPSGYAIEAGRLEESELLEAEDHHVVSNVLGATPLSVELSGGIALRPRDTIVLGSDGLFDNFTSEAIAELACRGSLELAAGALLEQLDLAVRSPDGKCDDHSFIVLRKTRRPRA